MDKFQNLHGQFASRNVLRFFCGTAALGLVAACGAPSTLEEARTLQTPPSSSEKAVSANQMPIIIPKAIGFKDWCDALQLKMCRIYLNFGKVEAEKINARLALFESVLTSPSDFVVTREEFSGESLASAMEALGKVPELKTFVKRLDARNFLGASLKGDGVLSLAASEVSESKSEVSTLSRHAEKKASVGFGPRLVGFAKGLKVGGAGIAPEELVSFKLVDDAFELTTTKHVISQVPSAFLLEEVFGTISLNSEPAPPDTSVFRSIPHFKNWLVSGQRDIYFKEKVMDTLVQHLPTLLSTEEGKKIARDIFSRIGAVASVAANRETSLLQFFLRKDTSLKCVNEADRITVTMSDQFGINDIAALDNDGLEVKLYGIHVKRSFRFLPSVDFDLKKVEVYSDKTVIHGVPVVGTQTIPAQGGMPSLVCDK